MIKKKITYTNYDDEPRVGEFYFNISDAELGDMEMSTKGGLSDMFKRLIEEKDQNKQAQFFKDIILMSYGEKTEDGNYFLKEDEDGHKFYKKFEQSAAYSALYMELAQDTNKFVEFVVGILPKKYSQQLIQSGWTNRDFNNPDVVDAAVAEAKKTVAQIPQTNA